jgi:hypothetical protein
MARILVLRIAPERPVRRCHLRFSLSLIFLLAPFSVRGLVPVAVIKEVTEINECSEKALKSIMSLPDWNIC